MKCELLLTIDYGFTAQQDTAQIEWDSLVILQILYNCSWLVYIPNIAYNILAL